VACRTSGKPNALAWGFMVLRLPGGWKPPWPVGRMMCMGEREWRETVNVSCTGPHVHKPKERRVL